MKVDLTGKTAVITGAGGILMGCFARELAKVGTTVALLDINHQAALDNAAEICGAGGKAKAFQCDVLDDNSMQRVQEQVCDEFGGCDILINGAGGNITASGTTRDIYHESDVNTPDIRSFFDVELKDYKKCLDLNFLGTYIPTFAFMKTLLQAKSPLILNISSMNSYIPLTRVAPYSAAKAAINSLTQWLAVHFGSVGLRVNAIAPGFFCTTQNKDLLLEADGSLTERAQKMVNHTPMGRLGTPEDLIGLLLFLCDETASGFINGAIIPVDGGYLASPKV